MSSILCRYYSNVWSNYCIYSLLKTERTTIVLKVQINLSAYTILAPVRTSIVRIFDDIDIFQLHHHQSSMGYKNKEYNIILFDKKNSLTSVKCCIYFIIHCIALSQHSYRMKTCTELNSVTLYKIVKYAGLNRFWDLDFNYFYYYLSFFLSLRYSEKNLNRQD